MSVRWERVRIWPDRANLGTPTPWAVELLDRAPREILRAARVDILCASWTELMASPLTGQSPRAYFSAVGVVEVTSRDGALSVTVS